MNKKLVLRIVITFLFLMFVFLIIQFSRGLILNLQVYSNFKLIPLIFWTLIIAISAYLTLADIGFMKIGAILGIITGVLVILLQMVYNTSEFDLIESNDYQLIVETIGSPDPGSINVYKRVSPLFSEFVENVKVADNYDLSFEIVGETLIMNRCTSNACVEIEIELE